MVLEIKYCGYMFKTYRPNKRMVHALTYYNNFLLSSVSCAFFEGKKKKKKEKKKEKKKGMNRHYKNTKLNKKIMFNKDDKVMTA